MQLKESDFEIILKNLQFELQETKFKLSIEEEEKDRLGRELEVEIMNFKNKSEEIQNIIIFKDNELKSKEQFYER